MDLTLLGQNVTEAREGQRMTMSDAADIAGITPAYMKTIERGVVRPSFDVLNKLAGALETTISDLTRMPEDSRAELPVTLEETAPDLPLVEVLEGLGNHLHFLRHDFKIPVEDLVNTLHHFGIETIADLKGRLSHPHMPPAKTDQPGLEL